MNKIRIGTRESKLAVRQTELVIEALKNIKPELEFEIVGMKTMGDKFLDVSLNKIGGKGLFIKELEEALLNNRIDMAVHSLKDMPAEVHEQLIIAAYTEREDASDCLLSINYKNIDSLPFKAKVGTSSMRRSVQLKAIRPDFEILPLRGNIQTRIRKLEEGQYDAIVLAAAGLNRMGLEDKITQVFDKHNFIPAVGQGIVCIETNKSNADIIELLKRIDNNNSRLAAECERAYLKALNGNCSLPIGAYCEVEKNKLTVTGLLGTCDSDILVRENIFGSSAEAYDIGVKLADILKNRILKNM